MVTFCPLHGALGVDCIGCSWVAAVFIEGCVLHPCSLFGHSSLIALVVTRSVLQSAANRRLVTLEAIASVIAAVCPVSRAVGNCPPRIRTVHTVCRPTHCTSAPHHVKCPDSYCFFEKPTAVVVVTALIVQCEDSSSGRLGAKATKGMNTCSFLHGY